MLVDPIPTECSAIVTFIFSVGYRPEGVLDLRTHAGIERNSEEGIQSDPEYIPCHIYQSMRSLKRKTIAKLLRAICSVLMAAH